MTLILAFMALQSVFSVNDHVCIHDQIAKNYQPKQVRLSEARRRSLGRGDREWRPINMMFDYNGIVSLPTDKAYYIMNELMPAVAAFFKRFVQVKENPNAKWALSTDKCLEIQVPAAYRNPVLTGDLLIFVSFKNDASNHIASSSYCFLDPDNNRPRAGKITFQNSRIDTAPEKFETMFKVVIHEFIHVLGFSHNLYQYYVDQNENRIGLENVIKDVKIRDVQTNIIILPLIVKLTQDHFKCESAQGAELENQEDLSFRGSHWERRNYMNELMTASFNKGAMLSTLTLALLYSTGWYNIDFSIRQTNTWARGAGCGFLNEPCVTKSGTTNYDGWCPGERRETCTFNRYSKGTCSWSTQQNTGPIPSAFDYITGKIAHDPFADNCPYAQEFTDGDCRNPKNAHLKQNSAYEEFYGPGSRCFEGTFYKKGANVQGGAPQHSSCQKYECFRSTAGQLWVRITVGGKEIVECQNQGGQTPVDNYNGYIVCPNADLFCLHEHINECPYKEHCNNVGLCFKDNCICPPGYNTPTCKKLVLDCTQTKCAHGKCHDNTCDCEEGWSGDTCERPAIKTQCSKCKGDICYGNTCLSIPVTLFDSERNQVLST